MSESESGRRVVIAAGAVVADGVVHRPGWVSTADGTVVEVGAGAPPAPPTVDCPNGFAVPGFIDLHSHGGGGASYTDGSAEQVRRAAAFHRMHGTTTTVTSTVSAPPTELAQIVAALRDLVRSGVSAGIHLEGPWISRARCGAHDSNALRAPDLAEIDDLLASADGTIVMVTIAPELPGAMEAIDRFVSAGVTVAVGHTDADYDRVREAIGRGARVATHLFNAMAPLGHRAPGPPLALMEDPRVVVELVGDGVHLHPALVRDVQRALGFDRVALVTDAMVAAGMPDGAYRLGSLEVTVADGVARLTGTGAIAGSTATMDRLFARTVAGLTGDAAEISDEILLGAVAMTSANPARVLGRADIGVLAAGRRADVTVLDRDLRVVHVQSAR